MRPILASAVRRGGSGEHLLLATSLGTAPCMGSNRRGPKSSTPWPSPEHVAPSRRVALPALVTALENALATPSPFEVDRHLPCYRQSDFDSQVEVEAADMLGATPGDVDHVQVNSRRCPPGLDQPRELRIAQHWVAHRSATSADMVAGARKFRSTSHCGFSTWDVTARLPKLKVLGFDRTPPCNSHLSQK